MGDMERVLVVLPELFDRTIAAMQSFAPDRDTFQA